MKKELGLYFKFSRFYYVFPTLILIYSIVGLIEIKDKSIFPPIFLLFFQLYIYCF
jgi:hypothetical protein